MFFVLPNIIFFFEISKISLFSHLCKEISSLLYSSSTFFSYISERLLYCAEFIIVKKNYD